MANRNGNGPDGTEVHQITNFEGLHEITIDDALNVKVVGKYPIAIGAPESPTLPGEFDIQNKDASPVYHKKGKVIAPGPDNPVGVRYMPYVRIGRDEYVIHGTAWPSWMNLRAAVSLGCIRMLNNDVIQVFNRVDIGTPVVVTTN